MPRGVSLTLTESAAVGLFFIQRYRFLTIDQFARAADLNRSTAADQLRFFERRGMLGYFGNTGLAGHGKTPKAYFLTRKGWELLQRESDIPPEFLGTHKEIKVEARWSPQMYHRLRTVDVLISAEVAVRNRSHLAMVKTFLEYRRVKRGGRIARETTDYVDTLETAENALVPDAAFILENRETKKRALFFLEMDMATERIVSTGLRETRLSLHYKFAQYDRYLNSMRYAQKYKDFGDFGYFTMLFVTFGEERVQNIRAEMQDLSSELADYYRLTTFEKAMNDFLAGNWQSRALSDTAVYPLVREEMTGSG
jgi:Replication-relaxation